MPNTHANIASAVKEIGLEETVRLAIEAAAMAPTFEKNRDGEYCMARALRAANTAARLLAQQRGSMSEQILPCSIRADNLE